MKCVLVVFIIFPQSMGSILSAEKSLSPLFMNKTVRAFFITQTHLCKRHSNNQKPFFTFVKT